MNHKEMTAHIRNRIKVAGIKARVRMMEANKGSKCIQVFGISPEARFTDEESRQIKLIAKVNRLTHVRGLPIDVDLINCVQFDFYMPTA